MNLSLSLTNNLSLTGSAPDIVRVGAVRATGAFSSGSATIDISSLSIQSGDMLVLAAVAKGTASFGWAASGNNSGVFTEHAELYSNDTHDINLFAAARIVGATPDTSIALTGSSTLDYAVHVIQYRNAAIGVAAQTATGIDSDKANPPSITPTNTGARVVTIYGAAQSASTAWTAPAGVSSFIQDVSASAVRLGTGDIQWTGGAVDPAAPTGGTATTGDSWAAVSLALKPA